MKKFVTNNTDYMCYNIFIILVYSEDGAKYLYPYLDICYILVLTYGRYPLQYIVGKQLFLMLKQLLNYRKQGFFAPLPNQITSTSSVKMQNNTSIVFVPIMHLLQRRFLTLIQGR